MRKFKFNLETLLGHKKRLEEREREKLAWIHYRIENEHQRLQALNSRHSEVREEMAQLELQDYEPGEVAWYCSFLDRLDHEIEQVSLHIRALRQELEKQMAAWVERSKEKKVLENLRSRKEREHLTAAEKLEQKTVDEIVVTQFANKK
jgi:flagellar FliJ protein